MHSKQIREKIASLQRQRRAHEIEEFKINARSCMIQANAQAQFIQILDAFSISEVTVQSFAELFLLCKEQLLEPFKNPIIFPPRKISIEKHILFWDRYLFSFGTEMNLFANNSELIRFFLQFKQKHSWKNISNYSQYAKRLIDIFEVIQPELADEDREQLAEWITDFRWLPFLKRMISLGQLFPRPEQFSNYYSLIEEGLLNSSFTNQEEASDAFLEIVKYANSVHIDILFQQKALIIQRILELLASTCGSTRAAHFWPPLFYLLNSQPATLSKFAKSGIISTCGLLIDSKHQNNIFGALSILLAFSCSGNKSVIEMLTVDEEMIDSKMWLNVFIAHRLYFHPQIFIRKLFFQLMSRMMCQWEDDQLSHVYLKVSLSPASFLEIVLSVWQKAEDDEEVLCSLLQCIIRLLHLKAAAQEIARKLQICGAILQVRKLMSKGSENVSELALSLVQIWEETSMEKMQNL